MNPFTNKSRILVSCLLSFLLITACTFTTTSPPNPQADPSAFNTAIAQTAAASTPLAFGGNASVPPTIILPSQAMGDEQAIKQALIVQLGWSDSQMQFTLTTSDGRAAYGTVMQTGQTGGAAWFAAKDSNGKWVIAHVGRDWPLCRDIQLYNFPINYVSHCEDDSGNVIDRSSGGNSVLPSNPTVSAPPAADVYAPDPLGPAWTGFWIEHGECYDLDLFSTVNDATCDLRLDANNLFTPQNGAVFDASPIQYAPSLNTCKTSALGASSIDPLNVTYICFKTNAGKYGFLVPREILADGVVFDAYLFP